jgi:ATP-dependent exoDNAse (exonuclease V) beta subunit
VKIGSLGSRSSILQKKKKKKKKIYKLASTYRNKNAVLRSVHRFFSQVGEAAMRLILGKTT